RNGDGDHGRLGIEKQGGNRCANDWEAHARYPFDKGRQHNPQGRQRMRWRERHWHRTMQHIDDPLVQHSQNKSQRQIQFRIVSNTAPMMAVKKPSILNWSRSAAVKYSSKALITKMNSPKVRMTGIKARNTRPLKSRTCRTP